MNLKADTLKPSIGEMREGWRYYDEERDNFYPWYTKPALEVICTPGEGRKVFEWGCGDSTNWYRKAGYEIYGVDDNHEWAMRAGVPYRKNEDEYLREIEEMSPYDIIVIDGSFRDKCLAIAAKHINPRGMIIIDNFHQPSVQADWPETDAILFLYNLAHEVYKEPTHDDWKTLIIYP